MHHHTKKKNLNCGYSEKTFVFLSRCHIRVIDTFGTEPAYNNEEYATLHGHRTNWGYWNLNCKQYMTMFRKSMTGYYWLELQIHDTIILLELLLQNLALAHSNFLKFWYLFRLRNTYSLLTKSFPSINV